MEGKKEMKAPMDMEEFNEHLKSRLYLKDFACVSRFKSVARAYRRKHITALGMIIPKRPFNNRSSGRTANDFKRNIYNGIRQYLEKKGQ